MFKIVEHIDDIKPFVADKKEIKFYTQSNGIIVGSYNISDNDTFDSPESIECRGISFNQKGEIVSRPLHKFFNVGEKKGLEIETIQSKKIVNIYDKIDGSMISTAFDKDMGLMFKSKRSFDSDVVKLALEMMSDGKFKHINDFSLEVAKRRYTAIFELTHPQARIVVGYKEPELKLLHIRDNVTGEYVLLDKDHEMHNLIEDFKISQALLINENANDVLSGLQDKKHMEGYVFHLENGDMVKVKCPWYLRFHKAVTFVRERDVAKAVLHGQIDDVKHAFVETGIGIEKIEEVEKRVKERVNELTEYIGNKASEDRNLSIRDFALKHNGDELFSFMMAEHKKTNWYDNFIEWYERRKLKEEFSLEVLDGSLQ